VRTTGRRTERLDRTMSSSQGNSCSRTSR
jgi:hypothetical protein